MASVSTVRNVAQLWIASCAVAASRQQRERASKRAFKSRNASWREASSSLLGATILRRRGWHEASSSLPLAASSNSWADRLKLSWTLPVRVIPIVFDNTYRTSATELAPLGVPRNSPNTARSRAFKGDPFSFKSEKRFTLFRNRGTCTSTRHLPRRDGASHHRDASIGETRAWPPHCERLIRIDTVTESLVTGNKKALRSWCVAASYIERLQPPSLAGHRRTTSGVRVRPLERLHL